MRMPPFHTVATLALSILALVMSLGAALAGAGRDSLYADPGRAQPAASASLPPDR